MKTKVLSLVHGDYICHTIRVLEISKALRKTGNYEIVFSGKEKDEVIQRRQSRKRR